MKTKKTPAALATLVMIGSASAATTLNYSSYTATSSTDISWVSPAGSTSVTAVNFGGGETPFGGVTWLAGTGDIYGGGSYNTTGAIDMFFSAPGKGWANNNSGTFYPGGPALLTDGAWIDSNQNDGVDYTIDLIGFTVGQAYLVQFVFADDRADQVGRTITIDNYSANIAANADFPSTQYAYNDGKFLIVTASFTPGSGDTSFSFRPIVCSQGLQINGIQVLAVPEPGAALLSGLGMLALLRRRR